MDDDAARRFGQRRVPHYRADTGTYALAPSLSHLEGRTRPYHYDMIADLNGSGFLRYEDAFREATADADVVEIGPGFNAGLVPLVKDWRLRSFTGIDIIAGADAACSANVPVTAYPTTFVVDDPVRYLRARKGPLAVISHFALEMITDDDYFADLAQAIGAVTPPDALTVHASVFVQYGGDEYERSVLRRERALHDAGFTPVRSPSPLFPVPCVWRKR